MDCCILYRLLRIRLDLSSQYDEVPVRLRSHRISYGADDMPRNRHSCFISFFHQYFSGVFCSSVASLLTLPCWWKEGKT